MQIIGSNYPQQNPQNVAQQNQQQSTPQPQQQPQQKPKGKKQVDYSKKSVRELANLLSKIEKDKEKVKAEMIALKQKSEQIAKILTQKLNPNG